MSGIGKDDFREPPTAVRAEAAAWIARLHGLQRSQELENGLRLWLTEDPDHARAFERMTEAWEVATAASTGQFPRLKLWEQPSRPAQQARAAAILLVCGIAGFASYLWWGRSSYATDIGEQRIVRLDDGSRISLNSASRVVVSYDESGRRITLEEGEAFFEVAPNPGRPFVVIAGDRRVTALGTSFAVRYDQNQLAVLLVDGKVAVSSSASFRAGNAAKESSPAILTPGERLTFHKDGLRKVDTPPLEAVMAWRRGEVVMDKTVLADAVAEMNRYDEVRLVIDDPALANLQVSGIYRTGDSAGFALAVSQVHRLSVVSEGTRIHLRKE